MWAVREIGVHPKNVFMIKFCTRIVLLNTGIDHVFPRLDVQGCGNWQSTFDGCAGKGKTKKQPSTINPRQSTINLDGQHLWQRKNKKQPQSTKNETYHDQQFPSISIMNFRLAMISVSCCDFELPVKALITPYMIKMKSKRGITCPE